MSSDAVAIPENRSVRKTALHALRSVTRHGPMHRILKQYRDQEQALS